ncbi:MAG: large extracellular alpha-helical protein, partial [Deltaproteobacteria bacterium]|nr:large extracellular alpha-helical protein [Deltaproteobacteria bacterium]
EVLPEKASYKIGDKARYLIKNPFPGAQALISIERYGVIKHWVETLEGSTPVLEFEIEENFMPGFYLSIVLNVPRVDAPVPPAGEVDLGKPTYRHAYLKVPVEDSSKRLKIEVGTDQEVYRPREKVKASIQVESPKEKKQEPFELAVAVLDESVLDLLPGASKNFDPYEGFFHLDGLDLLNYNLLEKLVGRQGFEKKGANPGGDGGSDLTSVRSLFKYVSYWNPKVPLDEKGKAEIEFEAPDNLTGWRVLAFAVTPTDQMGLGEANFKVNQPTEIRPVLPNQVMEGDRFEAGFSVMNRSDQARTLKVTVEATGDLKTIKPFETSLSLNPYQKEKVFLPIEVARLKQKRGVQEGAIQFKVVAKDEVDGDALEHALLVYKRRALETAASYGTTTQDQVKESLKVPEPIYPDVGDISLVLSPTVIGNVEGAFEYMRDYPYECWEQKLSKAVMASHYQALKGYLPEDLSWPESKDLDENTLALATNYQASNGGMVYFVPSEDRVSPYLSAYTALAFNWLEERGHQIPQNVRLSLHNYLKQLLRQDSFPKYYVSGMSSTVRAVALAALAPHGEISLEDLERYRRHVPEMSLFGKSQYLKAALAIPGAEEIQKEVTTMLLKQANQSGGKMSFSENLDLGYTHMLSTELRSQCAILTSLVDYGEKTKGESLVGDIPFKLVRSITQARGNRDHWENTQENIFCMKSLLDYSKVYEKEIPKMKVTATLDQKSLGEAQFEDFKDEAVTLKHPLVAQDRGQLKEMTIKREGIGRLYYSARLSYATLADHEQRKNAGIDIRQEYSIKKKDHWEILGPTDTLKRGDIVKVDIFVSMPAARSFVVVEDPVPGGLEPLNRDLATTSQLDADEAKGQMAGGSFYFQLSDWHHYQDSFWNFYHHEIRHQSVRYYSDYLPEGNYHLSYMAQAIATGDFVKMPVHAEEMYDPDVYGKGISRTLVIKD